MPEQKYSYFYLPFCINKVLKMCYISIYNILDSNVFDSKGLKYLAY